MKAKLETAKLLQAAMEEMALYKKKNAADDETASIAVEFAEFIKKVCICWNKSYMCSSGGKGIL